MIASFYVLGLMIGSLITGKIITFGRRIAYILATLVVFIGAALMQIKNINIFMVGRLISGIWKFLRHKLASLQYLRQGGEACA